MTHAVYAGDPTQVLLRRALALIIDTIIATILVIGLGKPFWDDYVHEQSFPSAAAAEQACDSIARSEAICFSLGDTAYAVERDDNWALQGRLTLATAGFAFFNAVLLQSITGGTVGKLITGIRVVDGTTDRKAGPGQMTVRWLMLYLVDSWCCIGIITPFVSTNHRRVGDMVAGTIVVHRAAVRTDAGRPDRPAPRPVVPMAPLPGGSPSVPGAYSPFGQRPTTEPVSPPAATPPDEGPQWDEARQAYIQFDRARGAWMQFDEATQQWGPISQ